MTLGGRYDFANLNADAYNRYTAEITISSSPGAAVLTTCLITVSRRTSATANRSNRFRDHSGRQTVRSARGKQYEAGVKYVPKDMPVVVTAAVYQLTKDNNLTADPAN
jgi:iron complex outermembrane receptor protein